MLKVFKRCPKKLAKSQLHFKWIDNAWEKKQSHCSCAYSTETTQKEQLSRGAQTSTSGALVTGNTKMISPTLSPKYLLHSQPTIQTREKCVFLRVVRAWQQGWWVFPDLEAIIITYSQCCTVYCVLWWLYGG